MNHRELKRAEQEFWGRFAMEQHPEFFLSVTLSQPYADSVSLEAYKFAMRAIQRRIPSNRFIRGVCTLERTWKNAAFEQQLHLHALLWGVVEHVLEPEKYMRAVAVKCFMKLRDSSKRPMTRPSNIDLQYVYDPSGATRYTAKDIGAPRDRRSRVWLITERGFDTTTDYFE